MQLLRATLLLGLVCSAAAAKAKEDETDCEGTLPPAAISTPVGASR